MPNDHRLWLTALHEASHAQLIIASGRGARAVVYRDGTGWAVPIIAEGFRTDAIESAVHAAAGPAGERLAERWPCPGGPCRPSRRPRRKKVVGEPTGTSDADHVQISAARLNWPHFIVATHAAALAADLVEHHAHEIVALAMQLYAHGEIKVQPTPTPRELQRARIAAVS